MHQVYDRHLGPDWPQRCSEPGFWEAIDGVDDGELWETHQSLKVRLIDIARRRAAQSAEQRGEAPELVGQLRQSLRLDALTVGFARRFATYKRANLILQDIEAIAHIGSRRQRCIDALTRLDAERTDSCRMLSFGQGRGGITRLYGWCDPGGALNAKWLANLATARHCQRLNDTNGAVVNAKLSRVQQLLMVIRGTSAPPVYSNRASRYGVLGTRNLGRA